MRPKFRAWTEEGKVMYYDVYPFKNDTLLLSYDEIAFDEVPASDFILMQYTGLRDKNGREIYEGDLVRYIDGIKGITCPVKFIKEYACFGVEWRNGLLVSFEYLESTYTMLDDLEVVGNIYENLSSIC